MAVNLTPFLDSTATKEEQPSWAGLPEQVQKQISCEGVCKGDGPTQFLVTDPENRWMMAMEIRSLAEAITTTPRDIKMIRWYHEDGSINQTKEGALGQLVYGPARLPRAR